MKEATERNGSVGRSYGGDRPQTITHRALYKNGPNCSCHFWPEFLHFFLQGWLLDVLQTGGRLGAATVGVSVTASNVGDEVLPS